MEKIVVSLTLINAVCILIDNWMLKRHKKALHGTFLVFFKFLRKTNIPNLHKGFAKFIISTSNKLRLKNNNTLGFVVFSIVLSILLTITAYNIGALLDSNNPAYVSGMKVINSTQLFYVYFTLAITVNCVFDVISLSMTRFHINKISTANNLLFFPIVLFDLAVAFTLSLILLETTFYITIYLEALLNSKLLDIDYPPIAEVHNFYWDSMLLIFSNDRPEILLFREGTWIPYNFFLYAFTSFIPTILLLGTLICLYLCKFIISISKGSFLHYLEKTTEKNIDKFKPFTLIGYTISAIIVGIKFHDKLF
jgi:hypothetical protein